MADSQIATLSQLKKEVGKRKKIRDALYAIQSAFFSTDPKTHDAGLKLTKALLNQGFGTKLVKRLILLHKKRLPQIAESLQKLLDNAIS